MLMLVHCIMYLWRGAGKSILGIRWFHFCRTSSVKNSDVFMGAYEVSYSNLVSFWLTATRSAS